MMIHVDPSAVRARLTLDAIAARYGLEMHDDEEADGWKVCGWCPGCGHARSSRRRHLGLAVHSSGAWLCRRCGLRGGGLVALVAEIEDLGRRGQDWFRALGIAAEIAGVHVERRPAPAERPRFHRHHRARTTRAGDVARLAS